MRKLRTTLLAVVLVLGCTSLASTQNRGSALQDAIYKQLGQFIIWYAAICTCRVR